MLGEFVNRTFFPLAADLDDAALAGSESAAEASSAAVGGGGQASRAGGVATMAKPTVAEMRARAAQNRPKLDARGLAMQATAAKIKPLSNFIYRTMQVGVLLIAAGTILGGVWADYSWGRFWGWDPKEVWALITLLVYLIPLHGRFAGWVNTFGLVIGVDRLLHVGDHGLVRRELRAGRRPAQLRLHRRGRPGDRHRRLSWPCSPSPPAPAGDGRWPHACRLRSPERAERKSPDSTTIPS